ncbi:hypothetical protein [Paraclostridium bifermentans]|uniref:hypothetical protein n=1 Tax=Paraclostridium bifermentans TaxID=1490 RepID=UPI002420477B|nr:hypothetical protein [Paraclostridium bifermentans]
MEKIKCVLNEKLLRDGSNKILKIALSKGPKFSKKAIENVPGGLAIGILAGSLFTVIATANECSSDDIDNNF